MRDCEPATATLLNHLPGNWGWPILGSAIPLVKDVRAFTQAQVARYGLISKLRLGNEYGAMVVGAENFKTILTDPQQRFSTRNGYINQLGRFYEGGLLLRDFDNHKAHRRLLQQAFKFSTMRHYVQRLSTALGSALEQWPTNKQFSFHDAIKPLLLDVGSDIFLGLQPTSDDARTLNQAFLAIGTGLGSVFHWDLPGTRIRKGLTGRRILHAYIGSQVSERRTSDASDMFSLLARATLEDGATFSDEEVIQHVAFLLFAAHDTTTSLLSHLMLYIGAEPQYQHQLREVFADIDNNTLSWEALDGMPLVQNILDETLRLHPPVPLMTRRTTAEISLEGIDLPPGTLLYMPSYYNHYDPQYWREPTRFDPSRFEESRQEHKQHSFCWHPFGGGAHKCIGMHFAYLLSKIFLVELLGRFQISLPSNHTPTLDWVPIPKPADGPPVRLTPITKSPST